MIDLAPEHLEMIRRILADHVPDCKVRAFGSRVDGTARDYSDLDLVIVGKERLDPKRFRHLKEAFEESHLPFRVDVLDWRALSKNFRDSIEKKCEVFE